MLTFTYWNIQGYDRNKLNNIVKSYDLFGVVETWTDADLSIDLPFNRNLPKIILAKPKWLLQEIASLD